MARTRHIPNTDHAGGAMWRAALYTRLSREDGDKPESDSISNQKKLLEDYLSRQPDMQYVQLYVDDGYTGTNFDRPDFQRLIGDIEAGRINCVVVKDLSRFGRDYIDVGRYLERWFPERGVRFIAIGDNIDSEKGPYDMLLPVKNIINEQYARDISQKVRSSFRAKQRSGEFIGAFASYGYRKDPQDHNHLVIDPTAAAVVRRIFTLFEQGNGKVKIAKLLNAEGVLCPSEYKKLNGEKYHNGQKLGGTTYWTYATIHRILKNQMYAGNMEQGRAPRQTMHGRAKLLAKERWAVVENTHEAIIDPEQWERVQSLLQRDTRTLNFKENVSPFAGFSALRRLRTRHEQDQRSGRRVLLLRLLQTVRTNGVQPPRHLVPDAGADRAGGPEQDHLGGGRPEETGGGGPAGGKDLRPQRGAGPPAEQPGAGP